MKTTVNIIAVLVTVIFCSFNANAQTTLALTAPYTSTSILELKSNITAKNGGNVISQLQEGAAIVELNGKFGLVNAQGQDICRPVYQNVQLFNHGYAAVKKDGKWGFINKQGNKIVSCRYDWVGNFNKGYAAVKKDGKWGFINEQGFIVFKTQFDTIKKTAKGQIVAQENKQWYYLDFNNGILVQLSTPSEKA